MRIKFVPFKSQLKALRFLLTMKRGGLFMRMGTGKTVTILTLIEILIYNFLAVRRVLLIAPIRVADLTWPDEIDKWKHTHRLSYVFLHGEHKDALMARVPNTDITAVNFEGIRWLHSNRHRLPRFDMLVVDESAWVKSHKAERTKMLMELSRFIPWVVILTGSPAPNGLMDLWAQIFLVDRGKRLGGYITHYRNRYFTKNQYVKYTYDIQPDGRKRIIEAIRDVVMVVEDSQVEGMPDIVDNIVPFELSPKMMQAYRDIQKEFFAVLDSGIEIEALNKSAQQQKLRQILSGFIYDDNKLAIFLHNERVKVLKELIESLNQNCLIAINFTEEVNLINKAFRKKIPAINRLTKKTDGTKYLRQWQAGQLPNLMANPASVAYGLNLQSGGHNFVWFSQTWSLAVREQFIARLARTGQKSTSVFNHIIVAKGTVDEVIAERVDGKDEDQRDLMTRLRRWRDKNG